MRNVRNSTIIREEINDLEKLISSTKKLLIKNPDDFTLNLLLEQDEHRKETLLKELQKKTLSKTAPSAPVQIIKAIADKYNLSPKEIKKVLDPLIEEVNNNLKNGKKVMIKGLGSFQIQEKSQKSFPSKNKQLVFSGSKNLKNAIK